MNWDKRFKTCCDLTKYNHYRKYYFYIPLSWAFPWKIALNKRFNIISINATTQALSAWVSLRSNSSVHGFFAPKYATLYYTIHTAAATPLSSKYYEATLLCLLRLLSPTIICLRRLLRVTSFSAPVTPCLAVPSPTSASTHLFWLGHFLCLTFSGATDLLSCDWNHWTTSALVFSHPQHAPLQI